jgi:hypothetical protein
VAHELVREPDWGVWYCDSVAVMLERGVAADSAGAPAHARLEQCAGPRKPLAK